jgi:hypothetical protein
MFRLTRQMQFLLKYVLAIELLNLSEKEPSLYAVPNFDFHNLSKDSNPSLIYNKQSSIFCSESIE